MGDQHSAMQAHSRKAKVSQSPTPSKHQADERDQLQHLHQRERVPPVSGATMGSSSPFEEIGPGCVVELHGLKNAAWLNGERAEVIQAEMDKSRFAIRLQKDGVVKKVRADNVRLVSGGPNNFGQMQQEQQALPSRSRGGGLPMGNSPRTGGPLLPGTIIALTGLRSAASLNGARGEILRHDVQTDRYEIRLEMDRSTKKVRKENLEVVDEP